MIIQLIRTKTWFFEAEFNFPFETREFVRKSDLQRMEKYSTIGQANRLQLRSGQRSGQPAHASRQQPNLKVKFKFTLLSPLVHESWFIGDWNQNGLNLGQSLFARYFRYQWRYHHHLDQLLPRHLEHLEWHLELFLKCNAFLVSFP